jgi:hypothetical protein
MTNKRRDGSGIVGFLLFFAMYRNARFPAQFATCRFWLYLETRTEEVSELDGAMSHPGKKQSCRSDHRCRISRLWALLGWDSPLEYPRRDFPALSRSRAIGTMLTSRRFPSGRAPRMAAPGPGPSFEAGPRVFVKVLGNKKNLKCAPHPYRRSRSFWSVWFVCVWAGLFAS